MARKPSLFGKIRHPKKRAFLAAMANTANVLRAAEIAGMDRDNHYLWLKKDPAYAAAFEVAWQRGTDALEAEAVRRAYEGVTKPIFHAGKRAIDVVQNPDGSLKRDELGKPIGIPAAVREYSDTLLIFLLKGRNPAVFGDRTTLKRWLWLPEFQAEYLQARRDTMSQTNARIQHNSGALASLGFKLVADTATPPPSRRTSFWVSWTAATSHWNWKMC